MIKIGRIKNCVASILVIFCILLTFVPNVGFSFADSAPENGIWVESYSGTELNTFRSNKKEDKIDFIFNEEHVSIRCNTRLFADVSGLYTLYFNTDDGVKVWLDGKQIVNDSGPHAASESVATVSLEKNTLYTLDLEYYNGNESGILQMLWKKPSSNQKTIVPAQSFFMPEYLADASLVIENGKIFARARMQSNSDELFSLVLKSFDKNNILKSTLTKIRSTNSQMFWESEKMDYNEEMSYKAYVSGDAGSVSKTVERILGTDATININAQNELSHIDNLAYGSCMEDVNHELYGGIYSQLIYGESFAEPAEVDLQGFTPIGSQWQVENSGINQLTVSNQSGGPKLMIDDSLAKYGSVSADVYLSSGEGPAGFITKVTNPTQGADNFNGYEIGIWSNKLKLAKHEYNYSFIQEYNCNAYLNAWNSLKVDFTEDSMKIFVNNTLIAEYSDPNPLKVGSIGLRAWNCDAKFRNIKLQKEDEDEKSIAIIGQNSNISRMWKSVVRGDAGSSFDCIRTDTFNNNSQSQRITFESGSGAVGINNMSLNRKGINFENGKEYEGYFYARSVAGVNAFVVLEDKDGSKVYAEKAINIEPSNLWKKYSFYLTPNAKDSAGRITIELRNAGSLDVGFVYFQAGEWGRFKGLPVRKDVAEALLEQKVTVLRFGGCMANNVVTPNVYKWKNMLDEPEFRINYKGWWYDYSSLGFGIIEFLDLCDALGVAAVPDFNSYESPQDMADFIDFATSTDVNNEWVQKRIQRGRLQPYNLEYIQFGNEERVEESYAKRFNNMADAVWAKMTDVILIVGDFDYTHIVTDPENITGAASGITTLKNHKTIIDHATDNGQEVWFDIHFWTTNLNEWNKYFDAAISVYEVLTDYCKPGAKFKFPVFEFNAHTHDLQRALSNAQAYTKMENYRHIFPIICSANALQVDGHNDNGWNQGLVFMNNDSVWLQPPAYAIQMSVKTFQPIVIESNIDGNTENLLCSATKSEDGKTIVIKVVNSAKNPMQIRLNINGFDYDNYSVKTSVLTGTLGSANTANNPTNITAVYSNSKKMEKNSLITVAAYSYTIYEITPYTESSTNNGDSNNNSNHNNQGGCGTITLNLDGFMLKLNIVALTALLTIAFAKKKKRQFNS